jgi:hypothetical protein
MVVGVDRDPDEREPVDDAGPYVDGPEAHAAGEHHDVEARHGGCHGGDPRS